MTGAIEEAWAALDESTRKVHDAAKRAATLAGRLNSAAEDGNIVLVARSLEGLTAAKAELAARMEEAEALARVVQGALTGDALIRELEQRLRSARPDLATFRVYGDLVVYPALVTVHGTGSTVKVTVDKESVTSLRPSAIVTAAETALKASDRSDRFLKSLHQSFRALNDGREVGTASLAALYDVLAINPTARSQYSMRDFGVDLQHLRAAGTASVTTSIGFRFEVANAAKSAIPIFEQNGDRINLGYVTFMHTDQSRD